MNELLQIHEQLIEYKENLGQNIENMRTSNEFSIHLDPSMQKSIRKSREAVIEPSDQSKSARSRSPFGVINMDSIQNIKNASVIPVLAKNASFSKETPRRSTLESLYKRNCSSAKTSPRRDCNEELGDCKSAILFDTRGVISKSLQNSQNTYDSSKDEDNTNLSAIRYDSGATACTEDSTNMTRRADFNCTKKDRMDIEGSNQHFLMKNSKYQDIEQAVMDIEGAFKQKTIDYLSILERKSQDTNHLQAQREIRAPVELKQMSKDEIFNKIRNLIVTNQGENIGESENTPFESEKPWVPLEQPKKKKNKKSKKELLPISTNPNSEPQPQPQTSSLQASLDYHPSERVKKLLDMPLNEMPKHSRGPANTQRNFSEREVKSAMPNPRMKQMPYIRPAEQSVPYFERCYSSLLKLDEQYSNAQEKETPITKTFKDSVQSTSDLYDSISESLTAFEKSLQDAKSNFLKLQPSAAIRELLTNPQKRNEVLRSSPTNRLFQTPSSLASNFSSSFKLLESNDHTRFQLNKGIGASILSELDSEEKKQSLDALDLALYDKLDVKFGLKAFENGQLDAIKSILNKKNCLFRYTKPSSKSIAYQLPALLAKGLVVYITSSINYMANQVQNLPTGFFGACYNNITSQEKNKEVQELIRKGEVKFFFVTPERLINDPKFEIPNVEFVVFEEPHYSLELSPNYRPTHKNFQAILKKRFGSVPVLALTPHVTTEECVMISEQFNIGTDFIFPMEFTQTCHPNVTFSRDQNTTEALISLLRESPKFKENSPVVIYVENRKKAEDLSGVLTQNGFRNQTFLAFKTELQKFEVTNNFVRNNCPILITTSGTDIGIDRSYIKRTVHYNLPKSVEVLAQEILALSEDSRCHVFLSEDNYHKTRVAIFGDTVHKTQVTKFLEKLMKVKQDRLASLAQESSNEDGLATGKRRRDGTEITSFSNVQSVDFNPFISKCLMKKPTEDMESEAGPERMYSVKVSEIMREVNLRKDLIGLLFEKFEASGDWMRFLGAQPSQCTVRFVQSKIETTKSALFLHLFKKYRTPSDFLRISVAEVAMERGVSSMEILRGLRGLQNEGAIKLDVIEEEFNFKMRYSPNPLKLSEQINFICQFLNKKTQMVSNRLDTVYVAARLVSMKNIEWIHKQDKLEALKNAKLNPASHISFMNQSMNLSMSSDESVLGGKDAVSSEKFNIFAFIESYLNTKDSSNGFSQLFRTPEELHNQLPITRNCTQREKSTLLSDLQEFVEEYIDMLAAQDSAYLDPKAYESEQIKQQIARQSARIGMGIPCFNLTQDWRSSKYWGRFYRYNPSEIQSVVVEILGSIDFKSKLIKKNK